MLCKLAVRNVRRSVRDYAIYFVTLLFGVAIFYAFNSIGAQRLLFELESEATATLFDSTKVFIALFSVVVAAVLGFLVLYANRMLIGRRKHEFGVYLTLGMSPGAISRIVLYETVFVGIVSLALGLALGFFLSQLLSFFTAALFQITLSEYNFVFSVEAFVMTLVCFAVIYAVVTLFNVITVNRFKLITLLSANARNEKVITRNPWVCLVVFVAAVALIAAAYYELAKNGLVTIDNDFWIATALMLVGTLAFFWSLAGFAIAVLTRLRGVYLRGLVPFTVRQIASKVNTAFVSLWMVCVLLFFAITTFSIGMGLISVFVGDIDGANPYDASIKAHPMMAPSPVDASEADANDPASYQAIGEACATKYPEAYARGQEYGWDMEAYLADTVPEWGNVVAASGQIDAWEVPGLTYADLLGEREVSFGSGVSTDEVLAHEINVCSRAQYDAQLELQGEQDAPLADDEYLLVNNNHITDPLIDALIEASPELTILGHTLHLHNDAKDTQLEDSSMLSTVATVVVPDAVVEAMAGAGSVPTTSTLNVSYREPGPVGDDAFGRALHEAFPPATTGGVGATNYAFKSTDWPLWSYITREEMVDQAKGFRLLISYLALYIGFVFLIATAAVLAIQQVSQATDSEPRYQLLSKLGCDSRMLGRSVLIQVLVYFLAPLGLAVCHSACAIGVFNDNLLSALGISAAQPIAASVVLVAVIYGGYMIVTYLTNRLIIRTSIKS